MLRNTFPRENIMNQHNDAPQFDSIEEAVAYKQSKDDETSFWQKAKNFGVQAGAFGGCGAIVAGVGYAGYKAYEAITK